MSDEMRWDQDAAPMDENTRRDENKDENVTYHYKFTKGVMDTGDTKDSTETPPRYAHYQVSQEEPEDSGSGKTTEKRHRRTAGRKREAGTFRKNVGPVISLAVVFGLVAGAVFQGVNRISDRFLGASEQVPLATTETVTGGEYTAASIADTVSQGGTVAGVAQAAMPSVVAITSVSIQEIRSFFGYGMEYPTTGSGSGIIVGENDDELLIATNNHVVEGATTLSVCFIGSDVVTAEQETQSYASGDGDLNIDDAVSAKIKGTDADNDLAVISVNKKDIPEETMNEIKIAQLGSSDDLIVGEQVVAIGNALGYGQTVTSGWVSALNRTVQMSNGSAAELIQTDAAINPGNSGGALLNMRGELIGINCAKYASNTVEGTGYAIPISKAQPILEELMNRKTRDKVDDQSKAAYLGIKPADLTTEAIRMYNMPSGAFVMEVTAGEAADAAGIQKNDIITKLDGQKVSGKADLNDKLQYYTAGEEVEIVVARLYNGEYQEETVTVTLGTRPSAEE
ncbi:trypsin-like peptidase domain-containing protein [Ruminococcus sp. 5_1_39BFAA]|uniref:trypsin-like peptidase domain-containing protein n=1 Tax=Ruminococcus sp. 5_1_39BFAA TaxID=457412 RepID=UPI0035682C86